MSLSAHAESRNGTERNKRQEELIAGEMTYFLAASARRLSSRVGRIATRDTERDTG